VGGDGRDDAAFTTLVERHARELRIHCYRMTGSLTESEELVQETFLKAWRKLDDFEGRASIRSWLYRPPLTVWFEGREAVLGALARSWNPGSPSYVGRFRAVGIAANRQPAMATFVRKEEDADFTAFAISLFMIADGSIVDATAFHDPSLFAAFGLPARLPASEEEEDSRWTPS